MASINHQFPELQDTIFRRYKKTVPHIIGGLRSNPYKTGEQLSWQLKTPEDNFSFTENKLVDFTYDEEVLEIYTEADDKAFRRQNRVLFDQGLLVEFGSSRDESKSPNDLTDADIKEIAALKQVPAIRKRIHDITSRATLNRIKDTAKALERSYRIIETIDERLAELG